MCDEVVRVLFCALREWNGNIAFWADPSQICGQPGQQNFLRQKKREDDS